MFFKLIKMHLLVRELYVYQNARCNDKKNFKMCRLLLLYISSILSFTFASCTKSTFLTFP